MSCKKWFNDVKRLKMLGFRTQLWWLHISDYNHFILSLAYGLGRPRLGDHFSLQLFLRPLKLLFVGLKLNYLCLKLRKFLLKQCKKNLEVLGKFKHGNYCF